MRARSVVSDKHELEIPVQVAVKHGDVLVVEFDVVDKGTKVNERVDVDVKVDVVSMEVVEEDVDPMVD